jgi:hypothetical protein
LLEKSVFWEKKWIIKTYANFNRDFIGIVLFIVEPIVEEES